MNSVVGLGQGMIWWAATMNLATGIVLVVALALDHLLARRVAASVRLWLFVAVAARLALPAGWQSPLGVIGRRAAGALVTAGTPVLVAGAPGARPSHSGEAVGALYLAVAVALLARWGWARF